MRIRNQYTCLPWSLCWMALIIIGCSTDGVPDAVESDLAFMPVQESLISESIGEDNSGTIREIHENNVGEPMAAPAVEGADQQAGMFSEAQEKSLALSSGERQNGYMGVDDVMPIPHLWYSKLDGLVPMQDIESELVASDSQNTEANAGNLSSIVSHQDFEVSHTFGEECKDKEEESGQVPFPNYPALFERPGFPVGYDGHFSWELPPQVLKPCYNLALSGVTIHGCVARGFIYNQSPTHFARNVTISITSRDLSKSVSVRWPFTLFPGERAPFEVAFDWEPRFQIEVSSWTDIGTFSVDAQLSTKPDLSRAFLRIGDSANLSQLVIHDERLYDLEDWQSMMRIHPSKYRLKSVEQFDYFFPPGLVKSDDLDVVASRVLPVDESTFIYAPQAVRGREFVRVLESSKVLKDFNVRIFQAVVGLDEEPIGPWTADGPEDIQITADLLDLRELQPYFLQHIEEESLGMQALPGHGEVSWEEYDIVTLDSVSDFSYLSDPFYIVNKVPLNPNMIFPNNLGNPGLEGFLNDINFEGMPPWIDRKYDSIDFQLWIGIDGTFQAETSTLPPVINAIGIAESNDSNYGPSRQPCDSTGALILRDRKTDLGYWAIVDVLLGTTQDPVYISQNVEEVVVLPDTVTLLDGTVRGFVRNLSEHMFARHVSVDTTSGGICPNAEPWKWPLSIQPGELAPFQILKCDDASTVDDLDLEVSAVFSENVDLSRSFYIMEHNVGSVYKDEPGQVSARCNSEAPVRTYESGTYRYAVLRSHYYLHMCEDQFRAYFQNIQTWYGSSDIGILEFRDLYARIEQSTSHFGSKTNLILQTIPNVVAYAAIVNSNQQVIDVMPLQLYTSVYGDSPFGNRFVEVNQIPIPSVWSGDSVRMMVMYPREDETIAEVCPVYDKVGEGPCVQPRRYEVWIGGANETAG